MYHSGVLIDECIEGLKINPDGIYVDATYGGGGHSKAILSNLSEKGKLIAIDSDCDAIKNKAEDKRLRLIYGNFRFLRNYLEYLNIVRVDGILADLGVSSHQFDKKERGFSFRLGGELDMRMNKNLELKASDILNKYDEEKLYQIFKKYSDIHNPGKLVNYIISERINGPFVDIEQFLSIILDLAPKNREYKYFAQVFQALRIEVNDEINALRSFLNDVHDILNNRGRLVVISYHSIEDRMVKNLIRYGNTDSLPEPDIFGKRPQKFKAVNKNIIIPSEQEIDNNNRAKSAKLRIAEAI